MKHTIVKKSRTVEVYVNETIMEKNCNILD